MGFLYNFVHLKIKFCKYVFEIQISVVSSLPYMYVYCL